MAKIPFKLNREQQAAVSYAGGPLLIIAGAGTGKTRVITERVAFLLERTEGLRPENILALTFTNRATDEMASRIRERLGDVDSGEAQVHTFHSFALKLVQEQSSRLQRERQTELLDNFDFWILLRRHMERLRLEVFWKNAEPGKFLKDLIEFMSRANDELVSVGDYEAYVRRLEEEYQSGLHVAPNAEEQLKREREIARVYRVASELLAEAGSQTYGDVIASAVRLLERFPDVRREYDTRLRAILVDEFQDTNVAQIELLELLARSHQSITVVGDDDQGIYRFRGASAESFNLFARKFPRFRQMKLTQNYRSTQRILRTANQLIAVNPDRFDPAKNLWTQKGEGERITIIESPEPDDEAFAVAERLDVWRQQGRPLRDMAVLFRAHSHRDLLIKALRRRKIPHQVVGVSVLYHPDVRDVMTAARFLVKAHDNIACARVLSLPRWALTEAELVSLTQRAARHPNRGESGRPSLDDMVREIGADAAGAADDLLKSKLAPFVAWADDLRKAISQRPGLAAVKILMAELARHDATAQAGLIETLPFQKEALKKPLRRVLAFVETWQKKNPGAVLKDFLEYLDLYLEAGGDITEDEKELEAGDAVRLMSVHAAKGLEFPIIIVLRLTQNYFPTKRRGTLIPFPEVLRKEGAFPPGDVHTQEERRLAYVAMTRAQEELILSTVVKPRWKPSEFLADVERDKEFAVEDLKFVRVPASGEDLANELSLDASADETSIRNARFPFWALRNAPVVSHQETEDGLKLSASSMESYRTCPMQFKFDHVYKLTGGPSAALTVGAVLHDCVKHFFAWKKAEGEFPVQRLEDFLNQRWRHRGFEDAYQEARYLSDAQEQLRRFYDKHIHDDAEVLAQEEAFSFPMGDFALIGRIDQMNQEADGRVELIDYKTGRPKDQKDAEKSLQLSVYALACRNYFHRPLAALSFYNLANGEKVVTERSAAQLELDQALIRDMAGRIRRRIFPPTKNYFCSSCDFLPVCPAWEEE